MGYNDLCTVLHNVRHSNLGIFQKLPDEILRALDYITSPNPIVKCSYFFLDYMVTTLFENDQKYSHFSDHLLDAVMKLDAANISQLSFLSSYKSYQKFDKSATILGSASGNLLTWTQVCKTKLL